MRAAPRRLGSRVSIDPLEFRRTLSRFPTGVTVVGTRHREGGVCGLTVNAFASVSLEPPLVLICVDREASSHDCIEAAGLFSVSVLSAGQRELALRFAEHIPDKFDGVPHRLTGEGTPLVDGAIAYLECRVTETFRGGDHTIFLARVERLEDAEGAPLVFAESEYTALDGPPAE